MTLNLSTATTESVEKYLLFCRDYNRDPRLFEVWVDGVVHYLWQPDQTGSDSLRASENPVNSSKFKTFAHVYGPDRPVHWRELK